MTTFHPIPKVSKAQAEKERPILFSGEIVRAILSGAKTQTRRVIKKQPNNPYPTKDEGIWGDTNDPVTRYFACPHGKPGERLWVKETHYWDRFEKMPKTKPADFPMDFYYRADGECCQQIPECQCGSEGKPKWRPSIHMPRWASRLTLEIVSVKVERLNEITYKDCEAEGLWHGARGIWTVPGCSQTFDEGYKGFQWLWESINGKGSWAVNPWVWKIEFKKL